MKSISSFQPPGKYEMHKIKKSLFEFSTFTPNPLTSMLTLDIDTELMQLLISAHRLLGKIDGMSKFLPNLKAIENIVMKKEAWFSCSIDGMKVSPQKALALTDYALYDGNPCNNYIQSLYMGLNDGKYTNDLLCKLHRKLIVNRMDSPSGVFRQEHRSIGKALVSVENLNHYNPTAPSQILKAMINLESFVYNPSELDVLTKIALTHYQFETIHPFMSGNGQLGRIIPYIQLKEAGILSVPLISVSEFLFYNKSEYFHTFDRVHGFGLYEEWIKLFIKAIQSAADRTLTDIASWISLREKNLMMIRNSKLAPKSMEDVFLCIECQPVFDITTIAQMAHISYNTASTILAALCELGIILQMGNAKRYRRYVYLDFVNCFANNIWNMGESL